MKTQDVAMTPQIAFTGTKATIEAWTSALEGMEAIATDTAERGAYIGSAWVWSALDASGGASAIFQRNLTANFALADGEAFITAGYINAGSYDITLSGDSDLVIIEGNDSIDRAGNTTSSTTPAINTDLYDSYEITALAGDITSMSANLSGTPTRNQVLYLIITGTASRSIVWGASFEDGLSSLPSGTTNTETLEVLLRWNVATSKWRCISAESA
jgi:hypothetical protein